MSEQSCWSTIRNRRAAVRSYWIVLLLLVAIAGVVWFLQSRSTDLLPTLTQLRVAVGQIENLEVDAARQTLVALNERFPDDPSLQQNLAVNAVSRLRQLSGTMANGSLDRQQIDAAAAAFPDALADADFRIAQFQAAVGPNPIASWLRGRYNEVRAATADAGQPSHLLASENAHFLIDQLAEHPQWLVLAGPLFAALEESSDDQLAVQALPVLVAASEANPRNLYLALETIRLAVAQESDHATGLLKRSQELARPLVSETESIASSLKMQPLEVADKAIEAVANDDWRQAALFTNYWTNMHKATAAYRADLRLATPHELDFISFDLSQRLASQWAQANQTSEAFTPVNLEIVEADAWSDRPILQATWGDFNLDGRDRLGAAGLGIGGPLATC
ncbi:MAG: hypothetical protein R3C05_20535 [Pirellulaceae bacterium]